MARRSAQHPPGRVSSRAWLIASSLLAAALVAAGAWGVAAARGTVERQQHTVEGVPVALLAPQLDQPGPGVIIAHGFAGSAAIMDPLATALARAGFTVAVLEFPGHGANPAQLPAGGDGAAADQALQDSLSAVTGWLARQPAVAEEPLALVGHSMGAGAVVTAGVADGQGGTAPRYGATAAISLPSADGIPVGDPAVPANLLLLWGSAEQQRFADAALLGLRAGYPGAEPDRRYGDFTDGSAREARQVPAAEHIGILWRTETAQRIVDWLAAARGGTASTVPADGRLPWLGVLYAGIVLAVSPLASALLGNGRPRISGPLRPAIALPVMLAAGIGGSLAAALAQPMTDRLPLAVGGYLAVWFGSGAVIAAGLAALLGRSRVEWASTARGIVAGSVLGLWLAVGLLLPARAAWSASSLVGDRAWLTVLFVGVLLAWFSADELLVRRTSRAARAAMQATSRLIAVLALVAAILVLGAPGFLVLLLPMIVPVFAVLGAAGWMVAGRTRTVLAPALVQAIPLGTMVATTFPLLAG